MTKKDELHFKPTFRNKDPRWKIVERGDLDDLKFCKGLLVNRSGFV